MDQPFVTEILKMIITIGLIPIITLSIIIATCMIMYVVTSCCEGGRQNRRRKRSESVDTLPVYEPVDSLCGGNQNTGSRDGDSGEEPVPPPAYTILPWLKRFGKGYSIYVVVHLPNNMIRTVCACNSNTSTLAGVRVSDLNQQSDYLW